MTAVCDGRGAALRTSPPLERRHDASRPIRPRPCSSSRTPSSARSRWPTSAGVAGTVDQDRLAGLHTSIGALPTTTRVRSALTSARPGLPDGDDARRAAGVRADGGGAAHVLNNLDRVHDRIGPGVVTLQWGASGRRSDGSPWSFRRREKLADSFDATFPPAFKILLDLDTLFNNPLRADHDRQRVRHAARSTPPTPRPGSSRVEKLGANGRWQAVSRRTPLTLVAGSEVLLRGVLRSVRSSRRHAECQLSFVAPAWAGSHRDARLCRGGRVVRRGAGSGAQLRPAPRRRRQCAHRRHAPRPAHRLPTVRRLAARRSRGAPGRPRRPRCSAASRSRWRSFRRRRSRRQVSSGRSASAASVRWSAHAV